MELRGGGIHCLVARHPKFRVILTGLGRHTQGDKAKASHMGGQGGRLYSLVALRLKIRVILTGLGPHTHG